MPNVLTQPVAALLPPHMARPERRAMEEALLARVAELLGQIIADAPTGALQASLAARSDVGALAAFLSAVAAASALVQSREPFAAALLRGIQRKQELLAAAGGVLSAAEVGTVLGISRQAVNARRRAGELLALPTASGDFEFPAAQFAGGDVLPGLARVLSSFEAHDSWARLSVLLTPSTQLGDRTPLDALRAGEVDAVIEVVRDAGSPFDEAPPAC